jgi:Tfp pilus assembly protein PilZ
MDREKRRNNRKLIMKPVEYYLVPSIIGKTFDGLITDISDYGACLLTTSQLKDRQRIIIEDKSCSSEKVAIVRWSEKYDDMFYKIGLEFTEDRSFTSIEGKRRYKRLNIKNMNIRGKMAFANYIKIIDISLEGLSIETDKRLHIGKEYILHLECEGKPLSLKGSIAWSKLKQNERNNKGDTVPIYSAGMKLTVSANEMREFIKFIELRQQRGKKREYFSLRLDELNIPATDKKYLGSSLHSL